MAVDYDDCPLWALHYNDHQNYNITGTEHPSRSWSRHDDYAFNTIDIVFHEENHHDAAVQPGESQVVVAKDPAHSDPIGTHHSSHFHYSEYSIDDSHLGQPKPQSP
jgi:hypothetical protein